MSETALPQPPRITEQQRRVLDLLMRGEPLHRIVAIVDLSPRDLATTIADPIFQATLEAEREAHWVQLACRVQALATQAVEILAGAIQDKSASVRTRAARLLLDYQLKLQRLRITSSAANQKLRKGAETDVRSTTNNRTRNGIAPMPGAR